MATIKDVARLAGVAPSTVSRVIAGSSRISPETHERVRAAMKELKYHPNDIARSLLARSTQTVGLVIARPAEQAFTNPFFPELLRGIGAALHEEGYNLLLTMAATPQEERSACLKLLRQRRVDGVLLTSGRVKDRLVDDLLAEEFPFVLVGRVPDERPVYWVNNDNIAVGAMAVAHLLAKGHRRIGLINGPIDMMVALDRQQGYLQALKQAGIQPEPAYQVGGDFTQQGGYLAMQNLLQISEPPSAVFCADDTMAVGALQALRDRGLVGAIALIGVNDDPLTALIDPPLSTIRIPVFDLGATAARMLVDLLGGKAEGPAQVILPSQLLIRASSNWSLGQ